MADKLPHSRTSRTRQAIAIIAWICLVGTAFLLWNARQSGLLVQSTDPGTASFLAAFSAFVSVFAWMLFNPTQTRTADSLTLFIAATATLFPPPLIAFNLISPASPLRWWVALGIFLLMVIAVLSHVPDEFFGVPRGRSTYIMPLPVFDRVENSVMDPNASWFKFNDLRDVVEDCERPSLAPRAYLGQDNAFADTTTAATASYSPTRPASEVDDILGSDFDLGLLDDPMMEMDLQRETLDDYTPARRKPQQRQHHTDRPPSSQSVRKQARPSRRAAAYPTPATPSTYRQQKLVERKASLRRPSALNRPNRQTRFAASLRPASADDVTPPTTFRTAPPPPPSPVTRHEPDPLDETPLQQREAQSRRSEAPPEYLQQTNRHRGERHRSPRRDDVRRPARSDNSTANPPAEANSTPRRQVTDRGGREPDDAVFGAQTGQETSKSGQGRSIFGIPLPFGRSASDSETTAHPEATAKVREREAPSVTAPQKTTEQRQRTDSTTHSRPGATPAVPEFERTSDAHGGELVEGVMTVRFDKGQKRANLHIPFSPPLKGMPDVECECVDDVPVRLKVPVRQSYGIRIEARRSDASEALEADVGFAAMYSPES
ncbi:MAG: hypothetical protein NXI04_07685 [Planctomycetaceae bacterium]|nr:hypothetical protein [Planctomycetaceae bacterium]